MSDKNLFEPVPLPEPIANEGNYVVIPDHQAVAGDGKASISQGFAPENSRLLDDGGKAVRRQDLNGFFNRLSQILYWVQSGGQFTYKETLNYTANCMIIYDNQYFVCRKENGPDTNVGIQKPGTSSTTYWLPLEKFGNFLTEGSSAKSLTLATDGLNTSYKLSGSNQASISPTAGKGYFDMNTFTVNTGIGAGTYSVKDILQRLVQNSHTHSAKTVTGSQAAAYCTHCCDDCSYCCNDCCDDCGDDNQY